MTDTVQRPLGARRAAFDRLVLPLAPALYRTARRMTRRADEASWITCDTVVRAWRGFDEELTGRDARGWLFGELWRTLLEFWQRQGRTASPPDPDSADDILAAVVDGDADELDRAILSRLDASPDVDVSLRQLPNTERFALLLVDVEDLSHEEAARALGCDVGTLAARLLVARARLCGHLVDYARRPNGVHESLA